MTQQWSAYGFLPVGMPASAQLGIAAKLVAKAANRLTGEADTVRCIRSGPDVDQVIQRFIQHHPVGEQIITCLAKRLQGR